ANTWFNLGDRDLATHLYRTARLGEGATLTEVTDEIRRAWGLRIGLVPMTDDRFETMIEIVEESGVRTVPFQEYFVGLRHGVPVRSIRFVGAESARPTFLPLIHDSEAIVNAPSNPLDSIGPIRALTGVDDSLAEDRERVVAISPIIAGAAIKGPADRMLGELGMEASAVGVARLYAPVCGTLVIDTKDAHLAAAVEAEGVRCIVTDTIMSTPGVAGDLARVTLAAVLEKGR
ncbi:MAG: 2-phospho-L-lactate transferase CofD family protein, partial [Actinomycetota bacterium]